MKKVGRFEILEKLGRGAFGMVYKGRDTKINRFAAIKMMSEATVGDPDLVARFKREAEAAGGLNHRNIVTIYDLGEEGGIPYIAMEFLEGRDLERLIKDRVEMSMESRIDFVAQTAEGLHYAHSRGVIHRDVKPANIRLLQDGTIKIMDFGIAKMANADMTRTGQFMGTVNYMSPEQVKAKKVDGRSDLFALGVVFYELVSGRRPFPGDSITAVIYKIVNEDPQPLVELRGTMYEWLEGVVLKCLEKDPTKRFADCQQFAEALRSRTRVAVSPLSSELEQILGQARERETGGDAEGAVRLLNDVLEQDPNNSLALRERKGILSRVAVQQAGRLAEQGRLEQARDELLRGQRELGDSEELSRQLGKVEAQMKAAQAQQALDGARRARRERRFNAAVELLEQARKLDPYDERLRQELAEVQEEKRKAELELLLGDARARLEHGQVQEARERVEKALQVDPHHLEAQRLLQEVEREKETLQRKAAFDQALFQGKVALEKGEHARAIAALDAALQIEPRHEEAKTLLGEARLKKVRDAERKALHELLLQGRKFLNDKSFEQAREAYERALRAQPGSEEARRGLKAAEEGRTTLDVTVPARPFPWRAVAGAGAVGLILLVIASWLVFFRTTPAARAIAGGNAALQRSDLDAARSLFAGAVEADGKPAEHEQARVAFCALVDRFAAEPERALEAREMLDRCTGDWKEAARKAWKESEERLLDRYAALAAGLARRGLESADPVQLKGAVAASESFFRGGYTGNSQQYDQVKALFALGQQALARAEDVTVDVGQRKGLYSVAQDAFVLVDGKEKGFEAFKLKNEAREKLDNLVQNEQRIASFQKEAQALLGEARSSEQSEATWDRAIQAYERLLELAARSQELARELDLDRWRDQAVQAKQKLERDRELLFQNRSQGQKVAALLAEAESRERALDLDGARGKYGDVLKEDPENAAARTRLEELIRRQASVQELVAAARAALAARDAATARDKVEGALRLAAGGELETLKAQVERLAAALTSEQEVAAKFRQADEHLGAKRYADAEKLYLEIADAAAGDLRARAVKGVEQARQAQLKDKIEPLLTQARERFRQGLIDPAKQALDQAERLGAGYPGVSELRAQIQAGEEELLRGHREKEIAELGAQVWPLCEPGGAALDAVLRRLTPLDPENLELKVCEKYTKVRAALARQDFASAETALQGDRDPRLGPLRQQAEDLRRKAGEASAVGRKLDDLEARVGRGGGEDRELLVQAANELLAEARRMDAANLVKRAQGLLERAQAIRDPEKDAAEKGRAQAWTEAAALLEGIRSPRDRAGAGEIFFRASVDAACNRADLASGKNWARRALEFDSAPQTRQWADSLDRFSSADDPNLKRFCRALQ